MTSNDLFFVKTGLRRSVRGDELLEEDMVGDIDAVIVARAHPGRPPHEGSDSAGHRRQPHRAD